MNEDLKKKIFLVILLVLLTFANAYADDYAKQAFNEGALYADKKQFAEAIAAFSYAIKVDPKYAQAYYNRGRVYAINGNYDKAIKDYEKAIECRPDYVEAYDRLCGINIYISNFDRAIAPCLKSVQFHPDQAHDIKLKLASLLNDQGLIYKKFGNYLQAAQEFTKAIELKPDFAQAYLNRAIIFIAGQYYDKAWADIHSAESLGFKIDPADLDRLKKMSGKTK